jgi:hypothetical protein
VRTTLLTVATTAALALATLTGCDPGPRWVADGSGYSGPRIGLAGSEYGRHLVYCVREQDYDPNPAPDSSYPSETSIREVEVSVAVADVIRDGETCPDGPSETIGGDDS